MQTEMKEAVKRINLGTEFYTPENCHIIELSNTPEDQDASIARARVKPGVTTRWHRLVETTERYVILEGTGIVEVGDIPPQPVSSGDVVLIPPACRQRITNSGVQDLIFLCICTPRYREEAEVYDIDNSG
jgi:mannose-6-phosphate isomerase-like protein (cupin superfamily)